ncbi:MAG TPA: Gfo/Idh/MocA family oxidoreductase [Longimicrobiales bacterium]|nr:Gfo/Idh/MocA family oxidoreductase [Longimicrobiales bacterium]
MSGPRLGFIGLGWIGAMRLDAVAAADAGVVAALCDPVPERVARAAAAHPRAAPFTEAEALLDAATSLGLDGVVIATPNALHAPQAIAALERGLAVFCQKPLALDAAEAGRIVAAARRADRLLCVDYSYRFTDGMRELHRLTWSGELGSVFAVESVFHNAYGPDKAWCHDPAVAGGGSLMDLGVHVADLALWVLGHPRVRSVNGRAYRDGAPLPAGGVDDFATARIELDGGATATVAVSWNAHAGQDCVIRTTAYGTAGGAEFRNVGGSFLDFELARFRGRQSEIVARESRDWLGRAIVAWARRLAESAAYDAGAEESLVVAHVIDAIYGGRPRARIPAGEVPLSGAPIG